MKKLNVLAIVVALSILILGTAQAEPANKSAIITKQKEILSLAKDRYTLEGQNLDIRGKLIALAESTGTANVSANQTQFKNLASQLKVNHEKIRVINSSIKSKWDELKALKPKKEDVVAPQENIIQ